MSHRTVDHLILGTGQATGTLLSGLPDTETIAVVERDRVGGVCVNTGCTPTKTLVASARVAHLCRNAADWGVDTGVVDVDFAAVMKRMDDLRKGNRSDFVQWIESLEHVSLVYGHGRFVSDKVVQVGDKTFEAGRVYVNVGTRSQVPEIPGLDTVPFLDHARLLELETRPAHLVILGGSYVGLEMGQVFRRLGSEVTIVELGERVISREDVEFSARVRKHLEDEGVRFHTGAGADRVEPVEGGVAVVVGDDRVEGSHVLVAVGRRPNTDDLGLEHTGVQLDGQGFIEVGDRCETAVPGVFGVGDVNGRGAFTHTAVNDAQIVLDLQRGGTRRLSRRLPTYALFVDPPLGRVGMTERQAVDAGHEVLVATREMDTINRAREMGETRGLVKIVVDAATERILGASILGVGGDEVINLFTAFMTTGRPSRELREAMFLHPTVSELMPFVLDTLSPSRLTRA